MGGHTYPEPARMIEANATTTRLDRPDYGSMRSFSGAFPATNRASCGRPDGLYAFSSGLCNRIEPLRSGD